MNIRPAIGFMGFEEVRNRRERRKILRAFVRKGRTPCTATIDNTSISKSANGGVALIFDPFWRYAPLAA